MTIHKNDDGTFVITRDGLWRPGIYESEEASHIAEERPDEELNALQQIANLRTPDGSGVITEADLLTDCGGIDE